MITGEIRKWLSVGTGIGVDVRGRDLAVSVVRVRPNAISVTAVTTIHRFRERPAAEWGREYNEFLRKAGCGHLTATVLLPREGIIVRQLSLPGVGGKDLAAAVRFQVDSLHPYPEEEVGYGWARVPGAAVVLIGIARNDYIESFTTLFAEAGVRTGTFLFSAAVAYSAVRMLKEPPAEGFLVIEQRGEEYEAYGESPARPIFSATFDLPAERIVPLATAELRLEPDIEPVRFSDLLPAPRTVPEGWEQDHYLHSYAAALAGACPWLALSANLLPQEFRSKSSRGVYAPTLALAVLLVLATGAFAVYGGITDESYRSLINQEIDRYTPDAGKVRDIEAEIAKVRARRELIRGFSLRTRADLDAFREITNLLAPPAWAHNLQIGRDQIMVSGEAPAASRLLEIFDASSLFRNSQYTSPISDAGQMQNFAIRMEREQATDGSGQ